MAPTCFFDSNGTLLDTEALDPHFEAIFGTPLYREIWFATVLHTSLVSNQTDRYREFGKIVDETLESLAEAAGKSIGIARKLAFEKTMTTLPLFPDVLAGLGRLQDAGYRLVVFSNSGKPTSMAQLTHAGVADRFEKILSTDGADAFKPALAAYAYAIEQLGVPAGDCWMIAGHAWDTTGAAKAGLKTALLQRRENGMNPCFAEPDVAATDLVALADRIIASDRSLVDQVLDKLR